MGDVPTTQEMIGCGHASERIRGVPFLPLFALGARPGDTLLWL